MMIAADDDDWWSAAHLLRGGRERKGKPTGIGGRMGRRQQEIGYNLKAELGADMGVVVTVMQCVGSP